MKIFNSKIFVLLLFPFFFGCGNDDGRRDIESYYFPVNKLKKGQVYEYQSVDDSNAPPMYWYYHTVKQEGNTYFIGMAYGPSFEPEQLVREERVSNGMLLVDFYTYETDATGKKVKMQANIEAGNVFSFKVDEQKPSVLLSSLNWQTLSDSANISLVRNRQYDGDTIFNFQGKEIPAIRVNTMELVEHTTEGTLSLESPGEECYAKGIGLVSWKKNANQQYQMSYRLSNIYPMEEFEEKFRMKLEEEEGGKRD